MDITEYLRSTGRSATELAKQVGIAGSHLAHLRAGRRHPSAVLEDRIAIATGGQVTHQDWSLRRSSNPRPWKNEPGRLEARGEVRQAVADAVRNIF